MVNFLDLRTAADRIRAASSSLSDPNDLKIISRYLQELEQHAARQEAAAAERLQYLSIMLRRDQRDNGNVL